MDLDSRGLLSIRPTIKEMELEVGLGCYISFSPSPIKQKEMPSSTDSSLDDFLTVKHLYQGKDWILLVRIRYIEKIRKIEKIKASLEMLVKRETSNVKIRNLLLTACNGLLLFVIGYMADRFKFVFILWKGVCTENQLDIILTSGKADNKIK